MGLTLSRIAIVLMVLTLGRVAWNGLMIGNVFVGVASGLAAAAFAVNWPLPLPPRLRMVAFIVQVLTIILIIGAVLLLLALSDLDRTDWEEMPWWFWPIVGAVAFVVFRATAAGYVLLKDDR